MKINGKEFMFDVADVDSMEKYEKALKIMQEKAVNAPKGGSVADKLKQACQLIYEFFDSVIEEGASKEIFGEKMNFKICFNVYEQFINDCSADVSDLTQSLNKYSSNRAQRRAK